MSCPKTEIDAQSSSWIEAYAAVKLTGSYPEHSSAKDMDAYGLLEKLVRQEREEAAQGAAQC